MAELLADAPELLKKIPKQVWAPAYDAEGQVRPGADVAELTDLLDLSEWPPGMRVIARRERPHPGAQLRFDDVDGYRITAFATNTRKAQLADLELRHRRRARCEDPIRIAKDTGLAGLPLHGLDANRIWCHLVLMAMEMTAWMQLLALDGHDARRWEPKRLRHRLFIIPATLARTGRRVILHLKEDARWAGLVLAGWTSLIMLALPDPSTSPCPDQPAPPLGTWAEAPGATSGVLSYPSARISARRSP